MIARAGRELYAHQVAWTLYNGSIPRGMLVCHKCDTPCCVNPTHLFLGTTQDNIRDKVSKSRQACVKGSEKWSAKLTESQVLYLRSMKRNKEERNFIAELVGMHFDSLNSAYYSITWKHLPPRVTC